MKITAIALVTIALFLIVAGCTQPSGTTSTSANPVPATSAAPLKQLVIGYQPSTHQMAEITAMDKGWFQQDLAPTRCRECDGQGLPHRGPGDAGDACR